MPFPTESPLREPRPRPAAESGPPVPPGGAAAAPARAPGDRNGAARGDASRPAPASRRGAARAAAGQPSRGYRLLAWAFHRLLVRRLTWWLWRWNGGRVEGSLPPGPFVLVANHSGHFDWLALSGVLERRFGREVRFVANLKVNQNPLWRLLICDGRVILVDYEAVRGAAVTMCRHFRDADPADRAILGVFPEGTRTRTGRMNPPSRGAAWVARRVGVPVVPVAVCGSFELWPPTRRLPTLRRVGLSLRILAPLVPPTGPAAADADEALTDEAMRRVYAEVTAARARRDPHAPRG